MSDQNSSKSTARKYCPRCGKASRGAAKVCSQCGYVFRMIALARTDNTARKRCPSCTHTNRLNAQVCTQCGYHFQGIRGDSSAATQKPKKTQQKWCPRCGNVCRIEAKVCAQCGHRFRTQFTDTPAATATPKPAAITESPIMQKPDQPLTLPQDFERPPIPAILDDPPTPVAKVTPSTSPIPAPGTAADKLEGEPAPDMSSIELEAMRRKSPDNIDAYGRLILSLKRKK